METEGEGGREGRRRRVKKKKEDFFSKMVSVWREERNEGFPVKSKKVGLRV